MRGYDVPESMEELALLDLAESSPTAKRRGASGSAPGPRPAGRRPDGSRHHASHGGARVYDQWTTNEIPFKRRARRGRDRGVRLVVRGRRQGRRRRRGRGPRPTSATAPTGSSPRRRSCYNAPAKHPSAMPAFFTEGTEFGVDCRFLHTPGPTREKDLGSPVLGAAR